MVTTTAVFTEVLVVGLQAVAWLTLLVLALFGTEWVDLKTIQAWTTLVTILVLATAYVLGVFVDRIADTLVLWLVKRVQKIHGQMKELGLIRQPPTRTDVSARTAEGANVTFDRMRLEVLQKGEGMAALLDYQRSRQRVARGTILNVICATPCVLVFLTRRTDASNQWCIVAAGVLLILLAAAVYANEQIFRAYGRNLTEAYDIVRG